MSLGIQLILIKKNLIHFCNLPVKREGQYWLTQTTADGEEERVISVEGFEGNWLLKSNRNAVIQDKDNKKIKELSIQPLSFYNIYLKNLQETALIYSEPISEDRRNFEKLSLPKQGRIIIGRAEDCPISYANNFTSSLHAVLVIQGDQLTLNDLNSTNGTFVNEQRVQQKDLVPGDIIYILGLKIIIGKGFIAINNPDGKMSYDKGLLPRFDPPKAQLSDSEEHDDELSLDNFFYRSPRFKRDIKQAEIKIDPPPSVGNSEETPIMLLLGPSITMGMAALFTGLLTLQNVLRTGGDIGNALPTLVMSFSLLLGTMLWPILTKGYEKKKRMERENLRQEKYKEYLMAVSQKIAEECAAQADILHENHVTIDDCIARIRLQQRNLWERSVGHNDFLKVRLGLGNLPLDAEIKYPEKRFTLDDDNLLEELHKLAETPKILEQVPITLSITEDRVSGIIGERSAVKELVKRIIIQLASLHSYDELKLAFIFDKKESIDWNFVKWLPHGWDADKSIRFVATNPNEVKELSAFFEKEIAKRQTITNEDELKEITPYYLIFAMGKGLAGKADMINSILRQKKNHGFSLIFLYDELKNLPKECSMVVELENDLSKIYHKNDITGQHIVFHPEDKAVPNMEDLAVGLANIQLDSAGSNKMLPNMLTFLEMFGVGKIEHLNALTRWKQNDPTMTLETQIGIDASGELFKLDLHEKFHGPHGLIAGMTGSGKSELIMTLILSLAVNYHPHEIAFILIDYKGGGMANAFTRLPHLAGTVTNLDGAAVKRSLISIQSELKRRQAIFSETSKKVNISNIDIYKYQKLYRDGAVSEPLQHLFIISDEFAELKTQQPEFMEQLVSAARIGRSLGVHLILATQKPSGVVDDQIWSNSRFRMCLKVQEKSDSMDVIKRPDAAELSVTGRFFVQIGFNELFELGQSAWGGAPYYPVDRLEKKRYDGVMVIDSLGRIIKQVSADKRNMLNPNPPKQIDEINKYLAKLAKEENITIRPLWLEPIPELIYLDQLKQKYSVSKTDRFILNPIIGEFDDPANQRQGLRTVPLTQEGNTVIYGFAGSGKTTFLTTFIYSLITEYSPSEVNLYILDFGSETLRSFIGAPHVGDVVLSHEAEKVNNLFKMLKHEVDIRKKRFSDFGGDYLSYVKAGREDAQSIVVVIQNYSAFVEIYENMEEAIAYLSREGLKYGIYFVVTALNTGALRYRILQNFKQLYVLQLNDPSDYSGILGNVDGVYPSKFKGRGIFKTTNAYEFQTAHLTAKAGNTFEFIRNCCREYEQNWAQKAAEKIPILPDKIDVNYLTREINNGSNGDTPIGVEKHSLNIAYYNFTAAYINLVLSQNNDTAEFIQGAAEVMAAQGNSRVLVIDPESMFKREAGMKYEYIHEDLNKAVIDLFNMLVYRNNTYKDAKEQGTELPVFDKLTCIINSLTGLINRISEDSKEKLQLFLAKGDPAYNINLILCDSVGNLQTVAYENWFRQQVAPNEGIWLGNGIADQYLLKVSKITNDLYSELGRNFGYIINKGKVRFIKLITSSASSAEVGD